MLVVKKRVLKFISVAFLAVCCREEVGGAAETANPSDANEFISKSAATSAINAAAAVVANAINIANAIKTNAFSVINVNVANIINNILINDNVITNVITNVISANIDITNIVAGIAVSVAFSPNFINLGFFHDLIVAIAADAGINNIITHLAQQAANDSFFNTAITNIAAFSLAFTTTIADFTVAAIANPTTVANADLNPVAAIAAVNIVIAFALETAFANALDHPLPKPSRYLVRKAFS